MRQVERARLRIVSAWYDAGSNYAEDVLPRAERSQSAYDEYQNVRRQAWGIRHAPASDPARTDSHGERRA